MGWLHHHYKLGELLIYFVAGFAKQMPVYCKFQTICPDSATCYKIAARYSDFIIETALKNRLECHEEIRSVMRELHARNIYPSREKVVYLLKKSKINREDERAVWSEMKIELGISKNYKT